MLYSVLLVALASVLAACGSVVADATSVHVAGTGNQAASDGTTSVTRTLTVDGLTRSYLVVAPSLDRGALPVVVVLHGRDVSVQLEAERTDFTPLAQEGKAILVYPAGYDESWDAGGGCCGAAYTAKIDDTAFITAVVNDVKARDRVDSSRIYLAGYSNGARMAFTEICAQPRLFAAFAEFGGVPMQTCANTSVAVPALISAGTADPELPTVNPKQTTTQVVDGVVQLWRNRDGCTSTSTSHTAASSVAPAAITDWSACTSGTAVESVLYQGLNHYWPRAAQSSVAFNTGVGTAAAAETLMWAFFTAHQLS